MTACFDEKEASLDSTRYHKKLSGVYEHTLLFHLGDFPKDFHG